MKIADLVLILDHLQQLYLAANAKTPAKDIKAFTDALRPYENLSIKPFVAAVKEGLTNSLPESKPTGRGKARSAPKTKLSDAATIDNQLTLLRATGTDRSAFDNVFASLKSAKNVSLAELAEIARRYADTVTKYKSKAAALDDISNAFVRQARFENKLR